MKIGLKKNEYGMMWDESVFVYPKQFSKLHQEKYVPLARRRISQLQTSALQLSVVKPFAEIPSNVVPSLSWSGVLTKLAYGPGETDMRAICCRELFRTITNLLEQFKEMFVRSASTD
jgi:hypothetical protein